MSDDAGEIFVEGDYVDEDTESRNKCSKKTLRLREVRQRIEELNERRKYAFEDWDFSLHDD